MNISVIQKIPQGATQGVHLYLSDLSDTYSICVATNAMPDDQAIVFRILNHTHQATIPAWSQCQILIEMLRMPYRVPPSILPDTATDDIARLISPIQSGAALGPHAHAYVMSKLGLLGSLVCGLPGAGHSYVSALLANDLKAPMYSPMAMPPSARLSGQIVTGYVSLNQRGPRLFGTSVATSMMVTAVHERSALGYYILRHPLDMLVSGFVLSQQLHSLNISYEMADTRFDIMSDKLSGQLLGVSSSTGDWRTQLEQQQVNFSQFMMRPDWGLPSLEQVLFLHNFFTSNKSWRIIRFEQMIRYPLAFIQELFGSAGYASHATAVQANMLTPARASTGRWHSLTPRTRTSVLEGLGRELILGIESAGFEL
ncbi:MAG: hypothetical protein JW395_0343 [Nitrospira sp.]|nr:hypothetical protein [Nitrospira sp.]